MGDALSGKSSLLKYYLETLSESRSDLDVPRTVGVDVVFCPSEVHGEEVRRFDKRVMLTAAICGLVLARCVSSPRRTSTSSTWLEVQSTQSCALNFTAGDIRRVRRSRMAPF